MEYKDYYQTLGVAREATADDIRKAFPSAHCKPLEWKSDAADRRCDDGKARFAAQLRRGC